VRQHHTGDHWERWLLEANSHRAPDHEPYIVEGRGFRTVARCTRGLNFAGWQALKKWRQHYRDTRP
jgi:hypothetical protein